MVPGQRVPAGDPWDVLTGIEGEQASLNQPAPVPCVPTPVPYPSLPRRGDLQCRPRGVGCPPQAPSPAPERLCGESVLGHAPPSCPSEQRMQGTASTALTLTLMQGTASTARSKPAPYGVALRYRRTEHIVVVRSWCSSCLQHPRARHTRPGEQTPSYIWTPHRRDGTACPCHRDVLSHIPARARTTGAPPVQYNRRTPSPAPPTSG